MTQFLSALLAFFLGLGVVLTPPSLSEQAKTNIEENLQDVDAPQGTPVENYNDALENSESDNASKNNESGDENADEPSNSFADEDGGENPDTEKKEAYNTKSEKEIGEVAGVAIEKAPPLISCDDPEADCEKEEPSAPVPTPSPTEPEPVPDPLPEPPVDPITLPPINIHPMGPSSLMPF